MQWFSTEGDFCPPKGHLAISADYVGGHSRAKGEGCMPLVCVRSGRGAAKHPTQHRTSCNREYLASEVISAKMEELGLIHIIYDLLSSKKKRGNLHQ